MKLALISDIHEDLENLTRALQKAGKAGAEEIVCLGDISGFSLPHYKYKDTRNAHECLRLLRENCSVVLLGNHDIHAGRILPKNCTFFDFPDDWYQTDYQTRHRLAGNKLWLHEEHDLDPGYTVADLEYLATLPEYHVYNGGDHKILLCHYIYPNLSGLKKEFYTYGDEFRLHHEFMRNSGCVISFAGHSHPRGYYIASAGKFRRYRFTSKKSVMEPASIGIPPVTRHGNRSGFILYETKDKIINALKI